jgi:hypothetical protein
MRDAIASLAPEKAVNSLDFVFDRNLEFNMNDRSGPGLMHEPVLGTARSMNFVWSMIYAAIYPSANLPATFHFLPSVISSSLMYRTVRSGAYMLTRVVISFWSAFVAHAGCFWTTGGIGANLRWTE